MSTERILLEFNEQAYNDLVARKEKADLAFNALIGYCEETLEIEIGNFSDFYANPKEYCIDAYWKKYGGQFGNAPVKKEKAMDLTGWSNSEFQSLFKDAQTKLNVGVGVNRFSIHADRIVYRIDPEDFKKYLREEDQALYDLTTEFIEMANKMEKAGGKVAWYLARYYPTLAEDKGKLVHSKWYFTSSEKIRNSPLNSFM
ncbi:MAG: hypothetical protein ABGW97_03035 [Christiangramia sp.]|uniref:hypothetical protein n=1 Tax=Christiangramia sp. TaxID=1931228 RepID=UPI003242C959